MGPGFMLGYLPAGRYNVAHEEAHEAIHKATYEPHPKRRKSSKYVGIKHWKDRNTEPVAKQDIDTGTYFLWLPMDVKRELFLYLPTLQAQRLSAGTNVCNEEFWTKKALNKYRKSSNRDQILVNRDLMLSLNGGMLVPKGNDLMLSLKEIKCASPEEYVALTNTKEHVLAFYEINEVNKDRILDAIVIKDLPLFEYYANHTRFRRDMHTKVIEWYAYFAGKDFYDVWMRVAMKYLGYESYTYQIEMAAVSGDMELFLKSEPEDGYKVDIIPAVITGGNLDMLRYLLEGKLADAPGKFPRFSALPLNESNIWDWNVARWIACANMCGHVEIAAYLNPLVRNGRPKVNLMVPRYHTVPTRDKDNRKYLWRTQSKGMAC